MMKELLERIAKENIFLEENDGKLQIHSESNHIPPDILTEILTHKQALIEIIKIKGNDYEMISAAERMDDYPLSHAQKRLWTLSQSEQASIAYNMPSYFLFRY